MSDNRDNKMPSFSTMADTDISVSDLDNMIERESGYNAPVIRQQNSQQQTQTQQSQAPVHKEDKYLTDMNSVLEESSDGVEENLRPIGISERDARAQQQVQEYHSNTQQGVGQDDAYSVAFELMRDLDVIRIPEGLDLSAVDANTLIQLKEQTLLEQRQEAFDYMRAEVSHDPYMLELLDYSYEGGMFANLPKMVDLLQKEIDWRVVNLNDEKIQKEVVRRYYAEGLNPSVDKDKKLIEFIPSRIDVLVKDKKLREEAEAARNHFMNKVAQAKQVEFQRASEERARQERLAYEQEQQQQAWDKAFRDSLAARNWTEEKKEQIRNEMSHIKLQDGSTMPMWEYKQRVIFENPALFQEFLDFVSGFDPKTGGFTGVDKQDEQLSNSAISKLVERLNKKGQNTVNGNANTLRANPNAGGANVVNPNSDWF